MAGNMQVFLVLLLIGCTHSQQQGSEEDCVIREEFDRVTAELDRELGRVNAKLLGIKDELDVWQKTTVDLFRRYLLDNQAIELSGGSSCNTTAELAGSLSQLQTDVQGIFGTINNNSLRTTQQEVLRANISQELAGSLSQLQTDVQGIQHQVTTINNNSLLHDQRHQELAGSLSQLQTDVQAIFGTINNNSLRTTQQQEELRANISQELAGSLSQLQTDVQGIQHQVSTINNNSIFQQTRLEQLLEEVTGELSDIKANQPLPGTFHNPAPSCHTLPAGSQSGYYWIQSLSPGNGTTREYCDTTRRCCDSTGGWMRVADLDMTDPTQNCPSAFRLITSPKRSCGRPGSGCVSTTFPTHGVQYSRVCGRVIAYQFGTTNAFVTYYNNRQVTIDDVYVDGVSLTHGQNPRKHIWTFAAALDEIHSSLHTCPCTKTDTAYTGAVPPFIGQDYFCDTGSRDRYQYIFYLDDPLWDGAGCGPTSTCCSFNNPPWFCKQLPQPTTDDIELRLCANDLPQYEDIPLETIELYVN